MRQHADSTILIIIVRLSETVSKLLNQKNFFSRILAIILVSWAETPLQDSKSNTLNGALNTGG